MNQSCGKSVNISRPTPFKATILWNEAVSVFQNGMPTRKHFSRMRYYDNCFTGKEAVEWLSKALHNNPNFGKNVTTDGTRKLIQHFLKSGVFQSIKGSLIFKESGLYEFVNRKTQTPNCKEDKHIASQRSLSIIDQNIPPEQTRLTKNEAKQSIYVSSPISKYNVPVSSPGPKIQRSTDWKDFILNRIKSLLPSLSVEMLVDKSTIQTDWVKCNVCPAYENTRNKTELPFLVFSAITSVIRPRERDSEYTTYCGFERDVYAAVRDYLRHRSTPMIPYFLYELIMYTFNHLHYLDLERKNRLLESDSVDDLMLSMSSEGIENHLVNVDDLMKTILPPNSCFETAFTSDEPVTRIVPQSSVDTVCLTSKPTTSLTNVKLNLKCKSQSSRSNNWEKFPKFVHQRTRINDCVNKKQTNHLRRTHSVAQIDTHSKWSSLPTRFPTTTEVLSSLPPQQSYINYGLSQSMDDLLAIGHEDTNLGLDFEEAMQSVNCLMQASCSTTPGHLTLSSYESLTTTVTCSLNKDELVCIDSCLWYDDIQEIARLVFQSVLMLMSPASRTSLRMLLQFIDQLSIPNDCSISKTEMVYDLSSHILSAGKDSKNIYSQPLVLSVTYFLVDNCNYIFRDIQDKFLTSIPETPLKENKGGQGPKVFCEQLTKNQFEDQGAISSCQGLTELLDQIICDQKMKPKEKKKRLKKFREAYPHIYSQRLTSNITRLVHLR